MKQYAKSLFIFRRDLRLQDNTALIAACSASDVVIPCFIFDSRQVGKNEYKSENAIQFMCESLDDLAKQLKKQGGCLYIFAGKAEEVISKVVRKEKIDAVFHNADYTPFSIKRDKAIAKVCTKNKIDHVVEHDALLNAPEEVLKKNKDPYTIFTPYWRAATKNAVEKPKRCAARNWYSKAIAGSQKTIPSKYVPKSNDKLATHGGRDTCQKILRSLAKHKKYLLTHDLPAIPTTRLSAHNKFGTCSIREVYHAIKSKLGARHPLLRQLYWRDFFTMITYHFPHVIGHAFHKKYDKLPWSKSKKDFDAWCEGRTGFPIVDAGMRELNTTGFMHNRVRMIVASFLVKDLHIDWRKGEKYFAQQLVDYDPAVNNGNWQWCASTGCDAQPYFRVFNPWLQQKKFDPNAKYIKQWVPELKSLTPKEIHTLDRLEFDVDYSAPLVDHAEEAALSKAVYKQVARKA